MLRNLTGLTVVERERVERATVLQRLTKVFQHVTERVSSLQSFQHYHHTPADRQWVPDTQQES